MSGRVEIDKPPGAAGTKDAKLIGLGADGGQVPHQAEQQAQNNGTHDSPPLACGVKPVILSLLFNNQYISWRQKKRPFRKMAFLPGSMIPLWLVGQITLG
jgi:hypothetical protein